MSPAQVVGFPQIVDLNRHDVTIQWETDRAVVGTFQYRSADSELKENREDVSGTTHQLKTGGLQKDTIYDYYLNDAPEKTSFKTVPGSEVAFRFMVHQEEALFDTGNWEVFEREFNVNLPDFSVVLNHPQQNQPSKFSRSSAIGSRSLILYGDEQQDLKRITYGNTDLLLVPVGTDVRTVTERLTTLHAMHLVVIAAGVDSAWIDALYQAKTNAILITSGSSGPITNNLILPLSEQTLVLDVDGDGVVATRTSLDHVTSDVISIKETPDAVKRSCIYCRKLLEAKKYQDSIIWYLDFIAQYQATHIVDDAQFQIGNIYDRYLYDYASALREYGILIENYPTSTKLKQARQRITYINTYDDYDFVPLATFEKTKSELYKEDRPKAIQTIKELVEQYPDAKIANVMLSWLGHALVQEDLTQSVMYYNRLISQSADQEKKEALIALGDAYYEHKEYRNAIAAYEQALITGDEKMNFGVEDKVHNSHRNILRRHAINIIYVLLGLLALGAIVIRPFGIRISEILRTLALLIGILGAAYGVWWGFYQNYPEILEWMPTLFGLLCFSHLLALVYSRKVFHKKSGLVSSIVVSLGFVLLNVLLFYVFLFTHHYLPAVGL